MDLLLWRHADAREGASDDHRPLTAKGERQAARMAVWLNRQLPESTKVLVGPSLRTRQTAEALERRFRTIHTITPEATVEDLLGTVRWPDAKEPVLVVGHQPTLGLTAAYLLASVAQPWSVRKGAVWWLRHRMREGVPETILHAVVTAELV